MYGLVAWPKVTAEVFVNIQLGERDRAEPTKAYHKLK